MKLNTIFMSLCFITFGIMVACTTTHESEQTTPLNSYHSHQNNAATTAAKMISPLR